MNLSMHDYLENAIKSRLDDIEGELDFFFDAALEFIVHGKSPDFPGVSVSEKRDLVSVLKSLDQSILELGMVVDWEEENYSGSVIQHIMSGDERKQRGAIAFKKVSTMAEGYLEKLFYFYCLAAMFYGGIIRTEPEVVVERTFPFEVFEGLKPYVVAKKLEKEFTKEDKALALKSINSVSVSDIGWVPPYADENAYIREGESVYLVYDVLRAVKK